MLRTIQLVVLTALVVVTATSGNAAEPISGPIKVRPDRFYPLLMPNGSLWGVSVQALAEGRFAVTSIESKDHGRTWGERRTLAELPPVTPPVTSWADGVPLLDKNGTLHYFILRWDQTDKTARIAKLALWHLKAAPPYKNWAEPKLYFDGYIGALLSAIEMSNGTLVSPFAYMTDRHYSKEAPGLMGYVYMGEHTTTAVYSTDGGNSFQTSPTPVNIRASIIIGNENGAIEPVCIPLKDGRAWMLMRTQLGRQWESFSSDGISWSSPQPSRFISSDSPAGLARLKDGRIVAIWNCCQRYPYAHGGRQILHAAISNDDGTSWHGFREVMRDPRRLEPAHPIRGDYGTAYPIAAPTADGKLVFATGQGQTTGAFLLDPAWLTETEQNEDFSSGLDNWSVYGTKGVEFVPHPDKPGKKVLRIAHVDRDFPAGAVWNFPNGRNGTVKIRFKHLPGSAKTSITLTDHYSSPFDNEAELNGLYTIQWPLNEPSKPVGLNPGNWHELQLSWNVQERKCEVAADGRSWEAYPQLRLVTEGVNYLRFHSLGDELNNGGIEIESISAHVEVTGKGISPSDVTGNGN